MKKTLLVISLFALSGSLVGESTPRKYIFAGKQAVDCLIRNGNCRDCDLSNQDLREAIATVNNKNRTYCRFIDLSGANLSGANLSGTDLSNATMYNADLTGANMTKTNLDNAIMTDANLSGAQLTDASMKGASMENVNLTGANLTGVDFACAHMFNVNMTNALILDINVENVYYLDTVIGYAPKKSWLKSIIG